LIRNKLPYLNDSKVISSRIWKTYKAKR
jgi:hypothetical protein